MKQEYGIDMEKDQYSKLMAEGCDDILDDGKVITVFDSAASRGLLPNATKCDMM